MVAFSDYSLLRREGSDSSQTSSNPIFGIETRIAHTRRAGGQGDGHAWDTLDVHTPTYVIHGNRLGDSRLSRFLSRRASLPHSFFAGGCSFQSSPQLSFDYHWWRPRSLQLRRVRVSRPRMIDGQPIFKVALHLFHHLVSLALFAFSRHILSRGKSQDATSKVDESRGSRFLPKCLSHR